MAVFEDVSPKSTVNEVEEAQLQFWRDKDIFQRTMKEREGGPSYVFYEGPPTANGRPGSHHVLSRAFKDMFPRYKTMQGYHVLRKGGWDTHGLPVEIEVEKQLGFKHKHEIEDYGIAEFNARCKESVLKYIDEWERLTERIAFWVDTDQAYYTFTNDYIQSVWWILSEFWKQDLLYQGHKVVPYCPRCETPLSSHEVNLGYDDAEDPSFYVRFKVKDEEDAYFLVWTTTPWTLPGNVALAVGEDLEYIKVRGENEHGKVETLYIAAGMLTHDATEDEEGHDSARSNVLERLKAYEVVARLKGVDLLGKRYEPLYEFLPTDKDHAYVVAGDFVSTDSGTGIVHMAPAFGADDLEVGRANDLPMLMTVAPDGSFVDEVDLFKGQWVKDADKNIAAELDSRGLVFKFGRYTHRYPFCWRCHTPLLYYARPTWFIRTTAKRDQLVGLNQTINWVPEHIRDGRFGNWLEGNIDWALGRERYWATPLPVWICDECGDQHCVGSLAELSELTGEDFDLNEVDLHRPYVDDITWTCKECGKGTMHRVPEVIDVWFDSGAMPFAQWGYPYFNQDIQPEQYPADYICEAVDQTRGWFYSLHAISSLLNEQVAFKNVICLGHILDGEGKKMSKSVGNIVEPWSVLDQYGADVFRWYMYTASAPGEPRRFSLELVGQSFNSFWQTLWNTYYFFILYANTEGFNPAEVDIPVSERDALDQWIISELNALVRDVTEAFENYDAPGATRPIEAFVVDSLSNWYVRRSRRRFWEYDKAAYLTLYECLVTVSKLLAPTMPFVADSVYRNLVGSVDAGAPDSVHLTVWPEANEALINESVIHEMQVVMKLVSLGHAARNSSQVKVRQPLGSVNFSLSKADTGIVGAYADIIADELNVKNVGVLDHAESVVKYSLNPIPALLGRKYGADFPKIQQYLRQPEQAEKYAHSLLNGENIQVSVNGIEAELTPEEVEVRTTPAEGFAVADEAGYLAALDVTITEGLAAEGLAREFIRRVQTLRRDANFEIDDRIKTEYKASSSLANAVEQFADFIKSETLTEELVAVNSPDGETTESYDFDDESLVLGLSRM